MATTIYHAAIEIPTVTTVMACNVEGAPHSLRVLDMRSSVPQLWAVITQVFPLVYTISLESQNKKQQEQHDFS